MLNLINTNKGNDNTHQVLHDVYGPQCDEWGEMPDILSDAIIK